MISTPVVFGRFAGRSDELDHLLARRRAAGLRRGGLVLLGGEAGIGKTRLVTEFVERFERGTTRVARVACRPFAQTAFGPIEDALRLLDATRTTPHFASIDDRYRDAVATLERIAERGTTILVIEDVHWADVTLLELLRGVVASAASRRLLVVATYRDDELVDGHPAYVALGRLTRDAATTIVTLRPLPGDEIDRLVRTTLGRMTVDLPAREISAIVRSAEGNPLFGEELLRHTVETGAATGTGETLPISLRAVLGERLGRCTDDERALLRLAGLGGRRFDAAMLERVTGDDRAVLDRKLARLVDMQLLVAETGATYAFRHELVRAAIAAEIPRDVARPLHARLATELESGGDAPARTIEIAFHRWQAGRPSGPAYVAAAQTARRDGAFAESVRWYERAIDAFAAPEAGADDGAIVRTRLALGTVMTANGERIGALEIFATLAQEAQRRHDAENFLGARLAAVGVLGNDGRREEAIRLLERTDVELPPETGAKARATLVLRLVSYYGQTTDVTRAKATLDRIDTSDFGDDARLRGEVELTHSWLAARAGDASTAKTRFEAALEIFAGLDQPRILRYAHVNYAMQAWSLGDLVAARFSAEAALAAGAESASGTNDAPLMLAMVAAGEGRLVEAARWLADAAVTPDYMSRKTRAVTAIETAVELADERRVRAALDLGLLDEAERLDDAFGVVRLACAFARALEICGRETDAGVLYDRAATTLCGTYQFVPAMLVIARRRPSQAVRMRTILADDPTLASRPFLRAALALVDAEIAAAAGDGPQTRLRGAAARDGLHRTGWQGFAARATLLAGDREDAIRRYRDGGFTAELVELERDRPESDAAGALTAREREVAHHVAEGATNREIAATMTISPKTVEKHVAAIYAKLAISSRSEVRALFAKSSATEDDRSPT